MKKNVGIFLSLVLLICLMASVSVFAQSDVLSGKNAFEVTEMMGAGFNIGNTFDSTGGSIKKISTFETNWGNPAVTPELIKGIKDAGFDTVRLPVTWYRAFDMTLTPKFTITPGYLERVKEVIDMCYDNNLFVILNIHHEAWVNDKELDKKYVEIGDELAAVWEQLANYFADYDQHLIFEAMNEPRMAGTNKEWNPHESGCKAINYLNKVFVNVVRSNGKGYNNERCLMIPGYAASSSSNGLAAIAIPSYKGKQVENIIISVHSYTPYEFCLQDKSKTFNPESSSSTGGIDSVANSLNSLFISKGIPVVMGETGATNSGDNTEERVKWATYFTAKMAEIGVPCVLWDNGAKGNSGGECHNYFNRATGEQVEPEILKAFTGGKDTVEWGSKGIKAVSSSDSESSDEGAVIFKNDEGYASEADWDANYFTVGCETSWIAPGRTIEITYSGAGEPKVVLDSEEMQAWWIPVDPDSIEDAGDGKKLAKFSYDSIYAQMKANKVNKASFLRNFIVIATNGGITTFSVMATGQAGGSFTYKVDGYDYYSGANLPEAPQSDLYTFLGWYTTPDYRAGSEFNGEGSGDLTVYANLSLTIPVGINGTRSTGVVNVSDNAAADKNESATAVTETTPAPVEVKPENVTDSSESKTDDSVSDNSLVESGNTVVVETPAADNNAEKISTMNYVFVIVVAAVVIVIVVLAAVLVTKKKKIKINKNK